MVKLRAGQALAQRVRSTVFVYPAIGALLAMGSGSLVEHPVLSLAGVALALVISITRYVASGRVNRLPLATYLRHSYVLGTAATLELGLAHAAHVANHGLSPQDFLFLFAVVGVSAGGIANLAPNRALQRLQLWSLVAPSALAMVVFCEQTSLAITVELGEVLYVAFMTVVGRRVHLDYVVGLEREAQLQEDAKALERARAEAVDSSRAKGEFLANMSHEIRTPLNGVLGMAQVLATTELTREQREAVSTIVESGEGLLAVLSDVLDFSKIESRKLRIEPVDFSPAGLARQVLALFEHTAEPKGLFLTVQVEARVPPFVRADSLRVRQVLLNVLSNALKFTERGGVVLGVDYADGVLSWSVRDTGVGMSAQTLERLFQPFTQGDASTTRRFGGTGLGLAISRQLAQLMGGALSVQSAPGEGSTFTLSLPAPLAASTAELHAAPQVPRSQRRAPARILVAEDNPINQRVAVKFIENLGCEAHVANDGEEVLRRLEGEAFDLVLMDCQMPQLDGYETTRAIRRREAGTGVHLPIVGMTASAIEGDRERALDSGMDDYLTKPVRLALLEDVVARYCPEERGSGL